MKKLQFTRRKIVAIVLAAALAVGCLPFMTDSNVNAAAPAPDYNGQFSVYSTYFNYFPFSSFGNRYGWPYYTSKLYMEYSADGGATWSRSGYMTCNMIQLPTEQGYCIGGLRPNTVYHTRIYYGDDYGNPISPYLGTTTVKTGMASKPKIKSVTCKAVNVKYHKQYRPGYYYWTGYHYIWMKGVWMKYYTYNVKVTVNLKKKPGTGGIFVNGRWLKGNKKKYTTTFKIPYPYNMSAKKPKGRVKYTVSIQSGQNSGYGGYSPTWKKTMKLK